MNSLSDHIPVEDLVAMPLHRRFHTRLLVRSAVARKTADGAHFVQMVLADPTGEVRAVLWGSDSPPPPNHLISVGGKTQRYEGNPQLLVDYFADQGPPDDPTEWHSQTWEVPF